MADPIAVLMTRLQSAYNTVSSGADPVLRPSDRADFQSNGALSLAKSLGRSPRDVAAEVVVAAHLDDICSSVEIAGPGFINLVLSAEFLASCVADMASDPRLGVALTAAPETVVIDYSAPNVAKEMHVGHLRTTLIGDALVRLFEFVGHRVIRENHLGDWGTPFGMLLEHQLDLGDAEAADELSHGEFNVFYQAARAKFEASEEFKARSRARVVALQAGEPDSLRLWHVLVDQSATYIQTVYDKLGVLLTHDDIVGESFYNPMLPAVLTDLDAAGLLVESDGAQCVFPPGFANRDGDPLPVIVQNSVGGYGYAATDLAAVRDRTTRLGATLMLYVVGAPQAQHFAMVWQVAEMAGWLKPPARCIHIPFGNVLGADGRMFRTRAGDSVKLVDLVDEAVERAAAVVAEKSPDLSDGERASVARAVGIGAVKYADLSTDRVKDYLFDWERMLAFDGNTAPYLQYAHARVRSIFRRGEVTPADIAGVAPATAEPAERALALQLLAFDAAVADTIDKFSPHRLCTYLFETAQTFTTFFDACPVLKAPDVATREGRLALCDLTARVLSQGLDLLGIETPDRM